MWTSVPQIEAILTRMRTSSAVGSGTGTCWTSVLFGADFNFTAAFIVATMPTPQPGRRCAEGLAVFQPCIVRGIGHTRRFSSRAQGLELNGVQLARSIPDHDEQVFLLRKLPVQLGIPRVDPEDRSRVQLRRGRDDNRVRHADPPDYRGAQLQVPPPQHEALGTDGRNDQLHVW